MYKPMLACDWHESKVKFPCGMQPKVDGVRSINRNGKLVGRSLKKHENKFITEKFSLPEYHGMDGEMYLGYNPAVPDLCRLTSQALRRREGEPEITWMVFDYITEETMFSTYFIRLLKLCEYIDALPNWMTENIEIVPCVNISNMEELLAEETRLLDLGYEGGILRDLQELHKDGRCGKSHMGAWRIKRFIDAEFLVEDFTEGQHNANEAETNLLGRTERATNAENMQPNGMIGNLKGTLLEDVLDPQTNQVLLKAGDCITVSAGTLSHTERGDYFNNFIKIKGMIGKFKFFPKGIKDLPRFPTFLSFRNPNDMSI